MSYTRKLGRSGMTASAIGMGCWPSAATSRWTAAMTAGARWMMPNPCAPSISASKWGATLFDTSDAYGTGHSEEVLGAALKGRREHAIIATKFGFTYDADRRALLSTDVSPTYIEWALTQSLRRLGTDYVDLYQIHVGELSGKAAESTGETLERLADSGRIRAFGGGAPAMRRRHSAQCSSRTSPRCSRAPMCCTTPPCTSHSAPSTNWRASPIRRWPWACCRASSRCRASCRTATCARPGIAGPMTESRVLDNLSAMHLGPLPTAVMAEIDAVLTGNT